MARFGFCYLETVKGQKEKKSKKEKKYDFGAMFFIHSSNFWKFKNRFWYKQMFLINHQYFQSYTFINTFVKTLT